MLQKLKKKIIEKNLTISIIGLGYVGLPCLISFAKKGFKLIGIDTNQKIIKNLKNGINHLNNKKLNLKNYNINFTSEYNLIEQSDVIIVCVPTPLTIYKSPDLSYLKKAINLIRDHKLKKNSIICLESTSYPGTTEEFFLPLLKKNRLKVGIDAFLVFSPEREDPGNDKYDLSNTTKIVSGHTKSCSQMGQHLYSIICNSVYGVSNLKTAEFTKLLENIYRSVNIGLINELKILCDKMGIDIFEAIDAAKTKPFGYQPFYPGPGLGGHCIPIDPYYLTWKAKEYSFNTRFTELSAQINDGMPSYVVEKMNFSLNSKNKNFSNSKILILGMAYKKNIGDTRESPFWKIIELLKDYNSSISVYDPYVINIKNLIDKEIKILKNLQYSELNKYDLIVLLTDHDIFDYTKIKSYSKLILDTRGRYKPDNIKVFRS